MNPVRTAPVELLPNMGRSSARLSPGMNRNGIRRVLWLVVYRVLYRFSPVILHGWRRMLLRCFGARIGAGAHPYPRARIWAPWNLTMERGSCLANDVDCYSVGEVRIGEGAIVSQYSYLCTASHDYESADFPVIASPILIGPGAWVAAGAFIGPGVRVGEGSVVGARSCVVKDVEPWTVIAGNPARVVTRRTGRHFAGRPRAAEGR